jgi:lipooligosaccharide transport system permease protein
VDHIDFFNYPAFLLVTPMFLLSGTFFPLSQLPPLVQTAAQVFLSLTHVVNITRGLVLGATNVFLLLSLVWIIAVTLVFFVLSINLMKKRLIK